MAEGTGTGISVEMIGPDGSLVTGTVVNLTPSGFFAHATGAAAPGTRVGVRLLGWSLTGDILLVPSEPPGVVVGLAISEEQRFAIEAFIDDTDVSMDEHDDPWVDQTDAGVVHTESAKLTTDDLEVVPAELQLRDLVTDSEPATRPSVGALSEPSLDESLLQAAIRDDGLAALMEPMHELDPIGNMPIDLEVPILEPRFEEPMLPRPRVASAVLGRSPSEASAPSRSSSVATAPRQAAAPFRAPSVASRPAGVISRSPSVAAPSNGLPAPTPSSNTLPTLAGGGYAVRFASVESYRDQFHSNLMHGGLVVLAEPLQIGTQKMLALEVPGFEKYTVSARVMYHQDGKVGFVLDSFALHKTRLEQMARP